MKKSKPYPHCKDGCRFIVKGECGYSKMHTPTIAVDFDRVLFTHEKWMGHQNIGEPIPGAREALLKIQQMGFKVMIWTTRDQRDIIEEACRKNNLPFDYINHNPNQPDEINPSKPVADYYVDDRALRFTSWPEVIDEIEHREKHDPYYRAAQLDAIHYKKIWGELKEMMDVHEEIAGSQLMDIRAIMDKLEKASTEIRE